MCTAFFLNILFFFQEITWISLANYVIFSLILKAYMKKSHIEDAGYLPPQALDIEESILGAMLSEKQAVLSVIDLLRPEFFYKKAHKEIFASIQILAQEEKPVDILTVSDDLKQKKLLKEIGGTSYLALLTSRISSSLHLDTHIDILKEHGIRRKMIDIASVMRRESYAGHQPGDKLLDDFQQKLFEIEQEYQTGEYSVFKDVVDATISHIREQQNTKTGGLTGVPSGFRSLDKITGGWQRGDLIVVAARPSMGKTAFALSLVQQATMQFKVPSIIFSLEMSKQQLATRLMYSETGIRSEELRQGRLSEDILQNFATKFPELVEAPIYVEDTAALSITELRSKSRRACTKHNIGLIIVDYLQLMQGEERSRYSTNREQEIAMISRKLKAIAKELNVPVIALSQLSRAVEQRPEKRPILSDLRESGAIEQDADMVAFLYRPEYYGITADEDGFSTQGKTEIIIAKHRNGATGSVWLKFIAERTKFIEDDETHTAGPSSGIQTFQSKLNDAAEETPPF